MGIGKMSSPGNSTKIKGDISFKELIIFCLVVFLSELIADFFIFIPSIFSEDLYVYYFINITLAFTVPILLYVRILNRREALKTYYTLKKEVNHNLQNRSTEANKQVVWSGRPSIQVIKNWILRHFLKSIIISELILFILNLVALYYLSINSKLYLLEFIISIIAINLFFPILGIIKTNRANKTEYFIANSRITLRYDNKIDEIPLKSPLKFKLKQSIVDLPYLDTGSILFYTESPEKPQMTFNYIYDIEKVEQLLRVLLPFSEINNGLN